MVKWSFLCNGGPNDCTVGGEADSLGKACGQLEAMMKSLGATIGQVERLPEQRRIGDEASEQPDEEVEA